MNNYNRKRNKYFQELKGREIFEITPIILGGSPTDIENKTLLNRKEHIQTCRYWNELIQELKNK